MLGKSKGAATAPEGDATSGVGGNSPCRPELYLVAPYWNQVDGETGELGLFPNDRKVFLTLQRTNICWKTSQYYSKPDILLSPVWTVLPQKATF